MEWTLDPSTYRCPEHGNDLTSEVWLEATAKGAIVVSGGGGVDAKNADGLDAPLSPLGPFLVVVTCPGKPDKDGADPKPHEQAFQGVVKDG